MNEKLKRLDNYEFRTAMLFAWLCVIALCALVISLNWHGMDFAPIPLGAIFIISLFETCRRVGIALADESETEEEETAQSEILPGEPVQDPARRVIKLSEDDFKFYLRLYFFVKRSLQSSLYQAKKDLELTQYEWEQFTRAFDVAGVTINNGTRARELHPEVISGGEVAAWTRLNKLYGCDLPASIEAMREVNIRRGSSQSPAAVEEVA